MLPYGTGVSLYIVVLICNCFCPFFFIMFLIWYWNAKPKRSVVPASPNRFICHFLRNVHVLYCIQLVRYFNLWKALRWPCAVDWAINKIILQRKAVARKRSRSSQFAGNPRLFSPDLGWYARSMIIIICSQVHIYYVTSATLSSCTLPLATSAQPPIPSVCVFQEQSKTEMTASVEGNN